MRHRFRVRAGRPLLVVLAVLLVPGAAAAEVRAPDGGVPYYEHVFPLEGPHGERGAVGEFGAARSGGRVHEGFDVLARCGTGVVAAVTGTVREIGYDPVLYGNYLLIHAFGEHRSYFYAHLRVPPLVRRGDTVWAGQRVAEVGKTGNARTVGCQLHFEIHVDGVPIDPEPELERWDAYS